jgi:Uncharacterised protein family (UPF0158)
MKRLRIDLSKLGFAFEHSNWETSYYLDVETGEVLMVGEETHRMLERIYESQGGKSAAEVDIDSALEQRELAGWASDSLKTAHRIEAGFGARYVQVPASDSFEGYADMKAFIETTGDETLHDTLWSAIQGKGALRRFKDTLAARPGEGNRWLAFKEEQVLRRITEWLESIGIEAEGGA